MLKLQDTVRERLCVSKMFMFLFVAVIKRTIFKFVCFDSAGSNGMGQAQSQSSGAGCDECYGNDGGYSHGKFKMHRK